MSSIYLQDCQYVEYIAYRFDESNPISNMSLQRVSNLKRIFGYIVFGPETFDRGLNSFYISEWNAISKADIRIKELFESAINSSSNSEYEGYLAQIEDLMHDVDPSLEEPVQGIVPATRLIVNSTATSFNRSFRATAISTNDLYYVMLLINMYNKRHRCVLSLEGTFNSCVSIETYCNKNQETGEIYDMSPSRFLFKHLYTVTSVKNMFSGTYNMTGVLYSPDYVRYASISADKNFESFIGTATPLAQNCTNIGLIGWNLEMRDDYAFWTPPAADAIPLYYDNTKTYQGCFESVKDTDGVMNNAVKILCAIDGSIDLEESYFLASKISEPFKNAERIRNSFNWINVTFDNKFYNGATYNEMLMYNTKVTSFENAFNMVVEPGSVIVDLFGGSKVLRTKYPDKYPSKIAKILSSFVMSTKVSYLETEGYQSEGYGYFVLTDDMFQRTASTLKEISPYIDATQTVDVDYGTFVQSNGFVVKTYAKYSSDNNPEPGAKFPYGIFANCTELVNVPAFFAGLDLSHAVDMTNEFSELTYLKFSDDWVAPDREGTTPLNVPIPNYYDSMPYVEKISMDGTVEHTAKIKLFKDNTKLVNMSSMFRNMIPPFENVGGDLIPGGFILTQDGFAGLTALEDLSQAFRNNHYFRGSLPLRLLYTGDTSSKKTCVGSDDAVAAKYGLLGIDIDGTSFAGVHDTALIKAMIDDQGTLNLGSTYKGLLAEARTPYGGYFYVPDEYASENVYVISYENATALKYNQFDTVEGDDGRLYPKFVPYDDTSLFHKKLKRYRRENAYEWYQRLYAIQEDMEMSSTELMMPSKMKNIKNIERLFFNNDAAGFLPLRYQDTTVDLMAQTLSYNENTFATSQQYKWNSFDKTEYIKANGKYDNKSLFRENPNYNPWTFIPNEKLDRNLRKRILWADITDEAKVWRYVYRNTIEGFPDPTQQELSMVKEALNSVLSGTSSDSDIETWISEAFAAAKAANTPIYDYPQLKGVECFIPNYDYDPRVVIINENLNMTTFNDLVYDGTSVEGIVDDIIRDASSYILDGILGGNAYPSTISNQAKEGIVRRQIPESWFNPRQVVKSPYISTGIDSDEVNGLGISYQNGEYEKVISTFELDFINHIKADNNFFAPSDILSYVSRTGNVKYAFSETTFQAARINETKFFAKIEEGYKSNPGNVFWDSLYDVSTAMSFYPEGNMYTGIPGKVSPLMFKDASTFSSIEGLFYKNPQLFPYSWSGTVGEGTVMGDLFDIDTFKPLENMTDSYLLWANNVVPRNVRISPETFKNNKKLYYGDYMFAGTTWYGYHVDDVNIGEQVQDGMFDSQELIVANSMFTSILNYTTPAYATGANIAPVSLIAQSPTNYNDGELEAPGSRGLRTVPQDLFLNSRDTLRQASNLFYYDQALTEFPAIYWYKFFSPLSQDSNFGTNIWSRRLFHAAYFLNSSAMNSNDINNLGSGGPWQLREIDPSDESTLVGSKRNYVSYFASGWDSKVNNASI